MADYYPLIARAVSSLASNTGEARGALYKRARTALIARLRGLDPPLSESEITREGDALEAAIRRVEEESSSSSESETSSEVARPQSGSATIAEVHVPDAPLNKESASADGPMRATQVEPTKPPRGQASNLPSEEDRGLFARNPHTPDLRERSATNSIKIVSTVMLGVACLWGLAFVAITFIRGLAWMAEDGIEYLRTPVFAALALCLCIFLPLALIRTTRFISVYGLLASSYLFGVTTWILGFLTTLQHWDGTGVIVGLSLGIVGMVPLGIIASALYADWWSVGVIIVGVFVTYVARTLALRLAANFRTLSLSD
jgi:hypothetical protein